MDFHQLIENLKADTWRSVTLTLPEIVLCATILALLLGRMLRVDRLVGSMGIALAGVFVAMAAQIWLRQQPELAGRQEMFTGLLVYDDLTVYFRMFLLFFAALFLILTRITGVPDDDAGTDIYTLVLGATLGMCFMASANHLLTVFLAVEMASVPSYALAGMLKGRRKSSEAALKYAVYGAGAAGVMLYGISLLAGITGSCHLPTMARQLASMDLAVGSGEVTVLMLGGLMTMVGLAFKLSAVPFHFWCPDVFEGATAEVNAFLSVASKGAALALLVRVALGLGDLPGTSTSAAKSPTAAIEQELPAKYAAMSVPDKPAAATTSAPIAPGTDAALAPARDYMAKLVAFIAVITCTFGNLAAYGQTNIKRLLAYSTIAHAGYMMMPVAAALSLMGDPARHALAENAVATILFYVTAYLFMNLGAFAIVAFLRNKLHSEDIADYAGLVRRCPTMVICLAIILFSLVGLPPMAGLVGKFYIFVALTDAELWTLLVIAGVNTVLSLFYYLRVVRVMTIDPEPEHRTPVEFSPLSAETWYAVAVTAPVLAFGVYPGGLMEIVRRAAGQLLS